MNDRLLSINGVNVKFAKYYDVTNLLHAVNANSEIYLVVERQNGNFINNVQNISTQATTNGGFINEDMEELTQIAARLAKKSFQNTTIPTNSKLSTYSSLPSLIQETIDLTERFKERKAPPIPPPRIDSRSMTHQKNRHAPVIKSMSNLLVDVNVSFYILFVLVYIL